MASVEHNFRLVLEEIKRPSASHYSGDKQIYYVTYSPQETMDVKRKLTTLCKLAEHSGLKVQTLSVADILEDFFQNDPFREITLEQEVYFDSGTISSLFEDLGASVRHQNVVGHEILAQQAALANQTDILQLITDVECLHPYSRFGPIEQLIYAELQIPLVVLYPGQLTGSSLEFLDIYPPDGSYRSKHF